MIKCKKDFQLPLSETVESQNRSEYTIVKDGQQTIFFNIHWSNKVKLYFKEVMANALSTLSSK